jgi:seryl-tRNA synthetase
LILTSEVIKENIAEFENKLAEEKAKYNKLLDETVELEKTQANLNLELFHLRNHNGYLGAEIAQKTADAKLLDAEVATLDINLKTSKDNRDKLELEIKDL